MRVDVFHNIRWSRYKAAVFSALHRVACSKGHAFAFVQIADTDGQRSSLTGVDLSFHQYPHELLFPGAYSDVSKHRLAIALFARVALSKAELVILPGYELLEFWSMLLAAIVSGKRRAVFCDSTLRDRTQSSWKGWLKRIFFSQCDGYFAYGVRSGELLRHYGAKPHMIQQRCQAAALPAGYSEAIAHEQRLRLAATQEAPAFLYVGRLSPEKSLDVLLRAFAIVLARKPAARLILVGAGPQSGELTSLSRSLGLGSAVEFAGSKDTSELADCYASASCLVLPSESEPWGLVVNEALHYGCPVVVSDNCGCVPELVHDGASGFVFRTGDIDDLADKMLNAINAFRDTAAVAERCMALIGQYTPTRAAEQILAGCAAILADTTA